MAEIISFGMTGDGHHMVQPLKSGEGGYRSMS